MPLFRLCVGLNKNNKLKTSVLQYYYIALWRNRKFKNLDWLSNVVQENEGLEGNLGSAVIVCGALITGFNGWCTPINSTSIPHKYCVCLCVRHGINTVCVCV